MNAPQPLIDADAWNALKGLNLLDRICSSRAPGHPIVLTRFIAEHELNDHQDSIETWKQSGHIVVKKLGGRDRNRLRLQKERRIDKGEAEAIAWALTQPRDTIVFVTCDRRATDACKAEKMLGTDVLGLIVMCLDDGSLGKDDLQMVWARWDDPVQQLGRPADYTVGCNHAVSLRRVVLNLG